MSALNAVTLIYIPSMISVTDFQPLPIAKMNIFHQHPRFYRQIYRSVKVHAKEEVPV